MGQITVGGTAPNGQTAQDNPLMVGGNDGSNIRQLLTDNVGRLNVVGAASAGASTVGNPVLVAGGDGTNVRIVGVNPQGQVFINSEGQKPSYTASILGYTPIATATDFLCVPGSGSKIIRITRVAISGVATSAAISDLVALLRSTANTSGTQTAMRVIQHDQIDPASTISPFTYSVANPTTGTLVGYARQQKLGLSTNSGSSQTDRLVFNFGENNTKGIVLRGTAQVFCLNWNGAGVPAGTALDIDIDWTEE